MYLKKIASIRTNNFQDADCLEKIQRLWQEHREQVAAAFASGQPFYAVYHDYASDYKGDYSLSLCQLTEPDQADFNTSEQEYEFFEVDKQDPQGILHTWQEIWQAEEAGQLERQYSIDFEKYEADQSIAIFIAKK